MGDTSSNHNSNSQDRNPTFYYVGTLDPLGGLHSTGGGGMNHLLVTVRHIGALTIRIGFGGP